MPLPLPGPPLPIMGEFMGAPPPSTAGTAMKGPRGPAPAHEGALLPTHLQTAAATALEQHSSPAPEQWGGKQVVCRCQFAGNCH